MYPIISTSTSKIICFFCKLVSECSSSLKWFEFLILKFWYFDIQAATFAYIWNCKQIVRSISMFQNCLFFQYAFIYILLERDWSYVRNNWDGSIPTNNAKISITFFSFGEKIFFIWTQLYRSLHCKFFVLGPNFHIISLKSLAITILHIHAVIYLNV